MAPRYVVTAPYITVVTGTQDGPKLIGLYTGAPVPADVSDESIKHHLGLGMIAKSGDAEKELAAAPGEPTSPTGSTSEPTPGDEPDKAAKAAPAKSTPAK